MEVYLFLPFLDQIYEDPQENIQKVNGKKEDKKMLEIIKETEQNFSKGNHYKTTRNETNSSKQILGPRTVFKDSIKPRERIQKTERIYQDQF